MRDKIPSARASVLKKAACGGLTEGEEELEMK